jgi:hypothetical protein
MIPCRKIQNVLATGFEPKVKRLGYRIKHYTSIKLQHYALCLIIFVVSGFSFTNHPYYMGVTEIKHNANSQKLEISIKLFANDLELALKKEFHKSLDVFNGSVDNNNVILNTWCNAHFNLKINSSPHQLIFLGYEIQEDVCWLYLEIPILTSVIKQVDVRQDMLYMHFKDQMHIVSFASQNNSDIQKKINPKSDFCFKK